MHEFALAWMSSYGLEEAGTLSKGGERDFAIEERFEEGEKTLRKWTTRVVVSEFENGIE